MDSLFQSLLIVISAIVLLLGYNSMGEWAKTPLLVLGFYQVANAFYIIRQRVLKYPYNVYVNQYFTFSFVYAVFFVIANYLGYCQLATYIFYSGAFLLAIVYNAITYIRQDKEIKSFV